MPDISSIGGTSTANQDVIRALKDHLHDTDYHRWVASETMARENAPDAAGVLLTKGASFVKTESTAVVLWKFYRPSYWTNGAVNCRLYYTGTTANGGLVRVEFSAHAYGSGEASPGTPDISSNIDTIAGTGTALMEADFLITAPLPVDASHVLLAFKLLRDGKHVADTYTGAFVLMGALLTYVPARQ